MNEELKIIISAEIDKLRKELDKGKENLKELEKQGKDSGSKLGNALSATGKAVGTAFKAITAAVAAAGAALVAVTEATREYRTQQAMLASSFEVAGGSAELAKETYEDLYRVLGDTGQATEASLHLAQLTTDQGNLAEWTKICQGVYSTFGDSLPIEALTEAANETAKTGEITGALADALNWAGISEDEFADKLWECNSEAEREALIRQTLSGIYGEAADTYEKTGKAVLDANEAQLKLTDSLAAAGAAVEPVMTILKSGLGNALSSLAPHFGEVSEGLQDMINGVEGGQDRFSTAIKALLDSVIKIITDTLPMILGVGTDILLALLDGIIKALPDIISVLEEVSLDIITALVEILPRVTEGLLQALPKLIDAIVSITASVLVALGDLLPEIVLQIVEIIPELIDSLLASLPVLLDAAVKLLMALVEAIPIVVMALVEKLPDIIMAIIDVLPDLVQQVMMAILDCLPQIVMALIELTFKLTLELPKILVKLVEAIIKYFANMWSSVMKVFEAVPDFFGKTFSLAWSGIKKAFGGFGNYFKDLWNTIKKTFSNVGATIGNAITNTVKSAINGVLKVATGIINGFIKAINIAIGVINAIPGVNIKKLSLLEVPKLARGGVLKKGQVGLLEGSGAEAVVPLEKNTEWLDQIALRLAKLLGDREGDGTPIVLKIDGKVLAQATTKYINRQTKQTGKLALQF